MTNAARANQAAPTTRVVSGQLHRVQRGHGKVFIEKPPSPPPAPVRRPARVAVMLALAHKIRQAIDCGLVRDQAEVARRLGFNRGRLTQLLDLTFLAPDIQEQILMLESVAGAEPTTERALRAISKLADHNQQKHTFETLRVSPTNIADT